jgi:hypothetical protein
MSPETLQNPVFPASRSTPHRRGQHSHRLNCSEKGGFTVAVIGKNGAVCNRVLLFFVSYRHEVRILPADDHDYSGN